MAFFLDNDQTDGNGSLSVDRKLDLYPFTFSGLEAEPMLNQSVTIVGGNSHLYYGTVVNTFISQTTVPASCLSPGSSHHVTSQFRFRASPGSEDATLVGGNSGAPVLNGLGRIVGIDNWAERTFFPPATYGGGTLASKIRSVQGFDAWYGMETVKDQTIGIFRPSQAWWAIDNGNGKWDNACAVIPFCDSNGVCYEDCFFFGTPGSVNGVPRSIPITGDWDGINKNDLNNTITVGVYRTDTEPNHFLLRNSNDGGSDNNITMSACLQASGCQPVAGKWTLPNAPASIGKTKVGVLALDGAWYLDSGDFTVNGCGVPPQYDLCFNTSSWTQPGDKPIAGDWDGNGSVTVGVFRPSTGTFYLSNDMPPTGVHVTVPAGSYRPVVGDWTGTKLAGQTQTSTKLGVFAPSTGGWWLTTSSLFPTNCSTDICLPPGSFGNSEDLPVAFGPSVIRAN